MAAGTPLDRSLLNADETAALVARLLPSTDERRVALEAASDADRAIFARGATGDLDALAYWGRRCASDQAHAFPRLGLESFPGGTSDAMPNDVATAIGGGVDAWSVAGVPMPVREALAIQAARRAARAAMLDEARLAADAANAGVTSHGGASVDGAIARNAWSRIDPEAQRVLGVFRRIAGEGV